MSTKHHLLESARTGWKFFVFVRQMFAKECNVATTAMALVSVMRVVSVYN